jgi:hypothetical protein
MRTKQTSLRTILAALLVAGGVGVACSSQQRSSESTTVAQAPLGRSTADYPSNPSVAPPDAAEAPEQHVGPAHPLSSGAIGGATTAPATNNPNATGPNGGGPNGANGANGSNPTGVVPVPVPANPGPNTGPMNPAPGTPTNPNTPAPTPSSPNAPAPTPAPNPLPPSGGAPIQGQPNPGTATPPSGGGPIQPTPGTPPGGTTPQSSYRGMSTVGARLRDSMSAGASFSPSIVAPSTVAEERGTFREPLDPYQVRSDGGIAPPPPTTRDAGTGPGGIRNDGGVAPPAPPRDGGTGPGIRNDGGIANPLPRGDGGLR